MSLFSLLSFFACIVYLALGGYVFRLDRKGASNLAFFGSCLALAVWAFGSTFLFSAPDETACWFWYRISALGWCLIPALTLHFFLILTNHRSRWHFLWYLPGIAFLLRSFAGELNVAGFVHRHYWVSVPNLSSPWYWAWTIYYLGAILLGVFLVARWGRQAALEKQKKQEKQARIIVSSAGLTLGLAFLYQTLMPILHRDTLPGLTSILVLIWVSAIGYAIVRYQLLTLTTSIAAEEIISRIMDLLILADSNGEIIKTNRRIKEILGYSEEELLKLPVSEVLLEEGAFHQLREEDPHRICELTYKAKNGERIPVAVSGSAIRDPEGEPLGVVIVGHDMRQTKLLQQEITERTRAEEAVRTLNEELERRVAERTKELAAANQALELRSRFAQLINDLATRFINLPSEQIDGAIVDALGQVGHFLDMERGLVRPFSGPRFNWGEALGDAKLEDFPWTRTQLQTQKVLALEVDTLPAEAREEKDLLLSEGLRSMLLVSVRSEEGVGTLQFESARPLKEGWDALCLLLETLGQTLINTLERQRAELALSQSENRYRDLFENANDIIYTVDLQGNFTSINKAGERLSGYSREELLGMNMLEVISLEHAPLVERMMGEKIKGDSKTTTYEIGLVTKDEQSLMLETSSRLIQEEGKSVGIQGIARDITERKRMEDRLNYLAFHDELTGLPNRPLFHDRLAQALAQAKIHGFQVAVMLLDLDRFKEVNDTLGHEMGDRLLQAVSQRLSVDVRIGDTLARTSGDEFYFIFSGIEEEAASEIAAQRMLDAFKQPFLVDGQELYVTPSIGISLYPQDGTDAEAMIKNPEMAMYWAKAQGKNNFQRFTPSMGAAAAAKRTLEYQLRKALEREEFLVYYQPQVDLQSGRLIGAEALVRWDHPERGVLAPAHFVDVAEEAGFVVPMGEWVLKHAAQQNKRWQEAGLSPIRVAVNLSARQFKKGLVELVRDTLEETGLDPRFLELEITESIAMQNHEETILLLGKLHDLGVKLSIDDFGTGYSSLSYLKRFPIDALKIDRAFVKDLIRNADDRAIAEAILAMARSLKLKVIAEGVEEEEQVVFLQEKGCDEVQGYYFSRPIPAEEFHSFLRLSKLWGRV